MTTPNPIEAIDAMIDDTKKAYANLEVEIGNRTRELQTLQGNLIATSGAIQGLNALRLKLTEPKEPQCLPEPAPSANSTS